MKENSLTDFKVMAFLLVLGLLFNMSAWFHPQFFLLVTVTIMCLLPVFLVIGLFRPHYLLWFIFLVFFTQPSFPNNVLYETYYGYESTTVYFHNFISILSVFDVLLFSSLFFLCIRKLMLGNIHNLFKGRLEYYFLLTIILLSLIIALVMGNDPKTIFSEFQAFVYIFILYILVNIAITDIRTLQRTITFLVVLLVLTIPIEFIYFSVSNYHNLLAVVGRIRKPLLNGIDDTYMVLPLFLLLSWMVQKHIPLKRKYQYFAVYGILAALGVIYLNIGRILIFFVLLELIIFFVIQRLQFRAYLLILIIPIFLFSVTLLLQPEHLSKLLDNFTSIYTALQNYKNDMSLGDRVTEFFNVHKTLVEDKAQWFGLGWGGLWREYYYQPGRGSLAAFADKTLTVHRQTHVLFSQLFVKCGYVGTGILLISLFSLFIHFCKVYRKITNPQMKPIMMGLLFTYPIYFYFFNVFQIGITFGIILVFLRRIEILNVPVDTTASIISKTNKQ